MMDSTAPPFRALRRFTLALLAFACALPAFAFNHDRTVPPIAPGRLPVACSNVAQDASRVAAGLTPSDYWEGTSGHYISELLTAPETAVQYMANVPDNGELFANHRNQSLPFVAFVCWPTSLANTDPDYVLPGTGGKVPKMQPAGTLPRIMSMRDLGLLAGIDPLPPDIPYAWPLIVFSHGLGGSPIDPGYIDAVVQLASQGFVVAAPFHADARYSRIRIQDFTDFLFLVGNFSSVVEMQTLRPVALKAMTDTLLGSPAFSPSIDSSRIGGFGASLGGEAMTLLFGSRITTTIGGHCGDTPGLADPRIRAAVGYVPFAGWSFLPAFCAGNSGASSVNRPYLAISGTADTTAPIGPMTAAINHFGGTKYLVEFIDGQHELRPEDAPELFTWTVTFLRAYLQDPIHPEAMGQFIRMNTVQPIGGARANDMLIDVHVPFAPTGSSERTATEFYNPNLNHYFVTADPGEIAAVQRGDFGSAWQATGLGFNVETIPPPGVPTRAAVCRFVGGFRNLTYSFYTADAGECDAVKQNAWWRYAGVSFYAVPTSSGVCPDGYIAVERAYNNGVVRNDNNHRFSTSDSTMRDTQAAGWKLEGNVFCAIP